MNDILLLSTDVSLFVSDTPLPLATPHASLVLPSGLASSNKTTHHRSSSLQRPWTSSFMIQALAKPIIGSSQRGLYDSAQDYRSVDGSATLRRLAGAGSKSIRPSSYPTLLSFAFMRSQPNPLAKPISRKLD